jgi:hypothetical protein
MLSAGAAAPGSASQLGWRDDAGDHFVNWPHSPTEVEAVEFVAPSDPRADAMMKTYDTSKGMSTTDWRMTKTEVCRAEGGYNDALTRWMDGSSIDEVAVSLATDKEQARSLVNHALTALQKRYLRDR